MPREARQLTQQRQRGAYRVELPVTHDCQVNEGDVTVTRTSVPIESAKKKVHCAIWIQCYRDVVLSTDTPHLNDVCLKLMQIAEPERQKAEVSVKMDSHLTELAGIIDPAEPEVIQSLRRECRIRTEERGGASYLNKSLGDRVSE